MRPRKGWSPEKGPIAKKTYYDSRGKVHLVICQAGEPIETADKAWCGVKLENCNHVTTKTEECTCQKCLMVATRTWGGKERGTKTAIATASAYARSSG
jgi:hypothetical protein